MFREHKVFRHDKEKKIWRYMDFTTFVAILQQQALHFTRLDQFDDPFEGSLPHPNSHATQQQMEKYAKDHPESADRFMDALDHSKSIHKRMRHRVAINCWHLNEHESAAMWGLYLKSDEGVAVQSTVGRLVDSFDTQDESLIIHVGEVSYIDYETESIEMGNLYRPILFKRKSFEHEAELRAAASRSRRHENGNMMITRQGFDENGIEVAVDLSRMIESVHVAPSLPSWIRSLVNGVLDRYGLDVRVNPSSLDESPSW